MMKLVEEASGEGEIILDGIAVRRASYEIRRFQGMSDASGLPIPGMHRIEGFITVTPAADAREWLGLPLQLKLEDGRVFGVNMVDAGGRILSEGHGPSKCLCC